MAYSNKNLILVEEAPNTYHPDAPHNAGLPSLQFWRPGVTDEGTDKKTGLETLPTTFEWQERESPFRGMTGDRSKPRVKSAADIMRRKIEALRAAKEYGVELPKEVLDSKYLAAIILKEARPDFGTTQVFNTDNKRAIEIYNKLAPRFGADAAAFAATVYDKGKVSERLNIPFPMAWNGTGVVRAEDGKLWASGKNYAERFPQFLKAAEHPKNAPLVNFIDKYLNANEYSTPLPKSTEKEIDAAYSRKKRDVYHQTTQKLKEAPLRNLQYTFLGGADRMLGVPKEYDPLAMEASVQAPDYDALRKQLEPKYKAGGSIENTTHYRKLI